MKTISVGKYEVLVDDWNYSRLSHLRLEVARRGVRVCWGDSRYPKQRGSMALTRVVIQTDAPVVDHKDRNWLNHQVDNLRPCTQTENVWNASKPQHVTRSLSSKFKGVWFSPDRNKWVSQVWLRGKHIHLGTFSTEEAAARAYDAHVRNNRGEFAILNFTGGNS